MSNQKVLLAKLRAQRTREVEIVPGKIVKYLRPAENDMADFLKPGAEPDKRVWVVDISHVCKYVVGWTGFTEADLLGEAVGSADEVAFDAELWAEVVSDRVEWRTKVADAILDSIVSHLTAKEAAAKN
jgi:hypothetical protein